MSFNNHAGITHPQTLLLASNDINGGTPHRHLTIDSNGRLSVKTHYGATIANQLTPSYEDTDLDVSALGAVGTASASIDMNGKRHLALMISQTATGGSGALTNIALEFSLDNTTWFRSSQMIVLTEVSAGSYTLHHKIEQVSARYVRLVIIGITANPSATTCSFSRSL